MYAIIETGGKQYRATAGDILSVERLEGKNGDKVSFSKLLLVGAKDSKILVGKPYVNAAVLTAEIVEQDHLGEKHLTIKYKRRKQYRRTIGHRQQFTRLLITKIEDGQGGKFEFDSAKRKEVLMKASVKFSTRQADHQAKHLGAAKTSEKKTATKTAAAKKPAAKKTK